MDDCVAPEVTMPERSGDPSRVTTEPATVAAEPVNVGNAVSVEPEFAAFPRLAGLVNLTDEQAAIWQSAYDDAVKTFPPTHAVHSSPRDCLFLKHKDGEQVYVSEVTTAQALDIVDGNIDPASEKLTQEFRKIEDPHPSIDPNVKVYEISIEDGKEVIGEKP